MKIFYSKPSGTETAFEYKADTCEYIIEAAAGKEDRKNAR